MKSALARPAFAAAAIAGLYLLAPGQSHAAGESCTALAGKTIDVVAPPDGASDLFNAGTAKFEKGDVVTVRIKVKSGNLEVDAFAFSLGGSGSSSSSVVKLSAGDTTVLTFTIKATASDYEVGVFKILGSAGVAEATFIGCGGEVSRQSQALTAARASLAQQSGLVFQRTNNLLLNKPQNRVAPGAQVSALPQAGLAGSAGQGADAYGVWADFTWNAIQNDGASIASNDHFFTLSGGYDQPIGDGLIAGAAISFGGASFDAEANNDDNHEINFGITPYIAYQIDDVFSVQAAAGYTHARGFSSVQGFDAEYGTNRYFVAGEASAFQSWDELALFGSVGLMWGQSIQNGYTQGGVQLPEVRSRLGSVSVTAQPSYLFTVDAQDGVFVEPYILGQYIHDFNQTKIRGAANDNDEFILGAGVNAFHGDGLSGAVEYTRSVGREDVVSNSARATVRMDF